ncbi:MAG: helix-turn-helix transcriptional regulator [Acidaminococcaceae bacterium]|nr:helix-turn-helix transcriptional regulator [Acidaminococcaceae bacterium]
MMDKELLRNERQRIGLNILMRRRKLNLTQNELAEASGISRTQISGMERGKVNFRMEALLAIAEALQVDYQDLLK